MAASSQQTGSGGGNEETETDVQKLNREIRAMNSEEFTNWYYPFLARLGRSLNDGLINFYESLELATHNHLKEIVPSLYNFMAELVETFIVSQFKNRFKKIYDSD